MKDTLKIVVASHKPYWMPEDEGYVPTWVGAALRPEGIPQGWCRDDEGENISAKNPNFCELTALYWAWKNLDADYVGLAHYRRYFAFRTAPDKKKRIASTEDLSRMLEKHPVILPIERNYFIETNYSQYIHAHHEEDLATTREILVERYPEYVPAYDASMSRTHGHRFNMFVMRRDLLDDYCAWLFDVLFELESRLDISEYTTNDARVFGFVSERLLDPWIETNGIDYVNMPVVNLESQHWVKKGTNFLMRKVRGGENKKTDAATSAQGAVVESRSPEDDEPLVSVVVPAYNISSCIRQNCLASLQKQTYTNLEMVFVDDGSTDGTAEILDDFAEHEKRAVVYHVANGGQSAARNYGIARAHGDLTVYMDGDDMMAANAIEVLVSTYLHHDVDMVIGSASIVTGNTTINEFAEHNATVLTKRDAIITLLYGVPGVSPWCKLAKTEFWQQHTFAEGHVYEDLRAMFFFVGDCEKVAIIEKPLYGYFMRAGSTTSTNAITRQRLEDYLEAIAEVKRYFEGNEDQDVQQALICRLAHEYTRIYRHLEAHRSEDSRYEEAIKDIVAFERQNCAKVLRDQRLPRLAKMRVLLLATAPNLFTSTYHLAVRVRGKRLS